MSDRQEHAALEQQERLSFDTQVDSLQLDGNAVLIWPETHVESQDDHDTHVLRPQATTQWDINTDGELYVESLEKRLKQTAIRTGRKGASNTESRVGDDILHLAPPSDFSGSEDGDNPTFRNDEDPPVPASETTCLLYDARQQQKERNRFLREETVNDTTFVEHEGRITENLASSTSPAPSSIRSSTDSATAPPPVQPILGPTTPQGVLSSRIQFSDSVRISGGIKSQRDKRRVSASSVFVAPARESELARARTTSTSTVEQSPPPSVSPSVDRFSTPRGSFSRGSGRISRAASFLSEDGNTTGRSRASTPASIYAPLLLPSKTAPSPGRHFYLTFQRSDGQATYRELVRRENERKKKKGHRRGRPKNRRLTKSWDRDENDEDVDNDGDSDSDSEAVSVSGWRSGLSFWTCEMSRIFRHCCRTRRRYSKQASASDIESTTAHQAEGASVASISDDEESVSDRRPENKSEMRVMFGPKPWRFLRVGYWMYRIREFRGSEAEGEDW